MWKRIWRKDKRALPRLAAHCLLKYKNTEGKYVLCFVRNISASGIMFYAKEKFIPGNKVELKLNFPSYPEIIEITAKIIRVTGLKKVGGFDVAIEFTNIDGKARDYINKKIFSIPKNLRE